MRRFIVWLFHALLIVTPFAFTAVNEELFEFNKMMVVYAFTALITGAWCARMVLERKVIFQKTPLWWALLLWVSSQAVSTLFSIHTPTSIFGYYSRFHGGFLSTLSYTLLYFTAASNLNRKDVLPLVRSIIFAGIAASLYAFPEHFGVSPSCVLISGEFSVACWVQDVRTRVFGTFGQPNWLAAYLLVLLPLSFWLWSNAKAKTTKYGSLASIPLFFVVLLFTGSRSGFLGLFAGAIAAMALWLGVKPKEWPSRVAEISRLPRALIVVGAVSFLAASSIFGTPFSPSAPELLRQFQPKPAPPAAPVAAETAAPAPSGTVLDTGGTASSEIRRIVWNGALAVWQRYPLFGSGVETFAYSYYQDRPVEHNFVSEWDFLYNKAHNEFLNILATTGIFGLGSLLVLMAAFVWELWRRRTPFAVALTASYAGLAVSNFFGFSTVMVGVLFSLMMALLFIWETEPEAAAAQKQKSKALRRTADSVEVEFDARFAGAGIVWFITGILLVLVWRTWQNDALLAKAKRYVAMNEASTAYQLFRSLTLRAPNEALYWDEQSLFLAGVAAAAAETDATLSAQLAQEAAAASNQAISLNPVHVTYWKTRAKVFLYLSTIDPNLRETVLRALDKTIELAPTDPKNYLNRALIYKDLERWDEAAADFRKALELKPNYDVAIAEWDKFQKLATASAGKL